MKVLVLKMSLHLIWMNMCQWIQNLNIAIIFMYENLFNHIDIKKENIYIPKGDLDVKKIQDHCMALKKKLKIMEVLIYNC